MPKSIVIPAVQVHVFSQALPVNTFDKGKSNKMTAYQHAELKTESGCRPAASQQVGRYPVSWLCIHKPSDRGGTEESSDGLARKLGTKAGLLDIR